jgi:hypothetical protein
MGEQRIMGMFLTKDIKKIAETPGLTFETYHFMPIVLNEKSYHLVEFGENTTTGIEEIVEEIGNVGVTFLALREEGTGGIVMTTDIASDILATYGHLGGQIEILSLFLTNEEKKDALLNSRILSGCAESQISIAGEMDWEDFKDAVLIGDRKEFEVDVEGAKETITLLECFPKLEKKITIFLFDMFTLMCEDLDIDNLDPYEDWHNSRRNGYGREGY